MIRKLIRITSSLNRHAPYYVFGLSAQRLRQVPKRWSSNTESGKQTVL